MTLGAVLPVTTLPPAVIAAAVQLAPYTHDTYARAWTRWESYAKERAWPPAAGDVVAWLDAESKAGMSLATVRQRLSAVAWVVRAGGRGELLDAPTVQAALAMVTTREVDLRRRAKRRIGAAKALRATGGFTEAEVAAILRRTAGTEALGAAGLPTLRARAILALAYPAKLRPSEIVGLKVNDVRHRRGKLDITIGARRISLAGEAADAAARALDVWTKTAGFKTGWLFRRFHTSGKEPIPRGAEAKPLHVLDDPVGERTLNTVAKLLAATIGVSPADVSAASLGSRASREALPTT